MPENGENSKRKSLVFHDPCHVHSSVRDPVRMRGSLEAGKYPLGLYLVTESYHPENMMEIIYAPFLRQERMRENCPEVLGMAMGKNNAIDLVRTMVEERWQCRDRG